MKSINSYYTTKEELGFFINKHKIQNSSALLVQVFSAISSKAFIAALLSDITSFLPDAVIIGSTTDGEIMDGKVSSGKIVLSFTQFEHTTLKVSAVEHIVDGYYSGQYLAKELIGDDTKLLIAFADGVHTNGEEFLNGIVSINDEVVVAGGHAGDNSSFVETLVFTKEHIFEKGAVGVTLNSKYLHVYTDHSFNWHPIGNELTVTKAEGNRVYTIDGRSAVDTYAHYLGEDIAKGLPGIGIEFPLIVNRDGLDIARATMGKENDGSLILAGSLHTGERVRIGFGDSKGIIKDSKVLAKCTAQRPSEVIFVYSCTARKHFMGDEIESEILPLQYIAPVSGFFTHGEFFTSIKKELLNQTMTLVSLSESDSMAESAIETKPKHIDINIASMDALIHLIDISSEEIKRQTKTLEKSNRLNQQLKERMEMALAGGKTSVLDWDFADNSLYISPSWKEMLGYRDDELPNSTSTWYHKVHPEDKKIVFSLLRKNQSEQIKYFENNHRLKHK
ncbi:MAG: FIST N-terminal domain-containing protein, partial [Campylobacterota bacterium]|nr:FIST N-terminal domain-containing protein [Campylobacterota bacterium]